VLRTLATPPFPTDFLPTWAIDADEIALVTRQKVDRSFGGFVNFVTRMDVQGHAHAFFTYRSHEGCGGGTSDPAARLYWQETGFGGDAPRMSWSVKQGLAAYTASCAGGVNVIDLRTGRTQSHPHWMEPALSARGTVAAVGLASSPPPTPAVIVVDLRSGRTSHTVARGELPAWSPDGSSLYFVYRHTVRTLPARLPQNGPISLPVYRSAVMQARADGSHATSLFSADAYGFGPLNLVNGGQVLLFSRIENDWNLWRHRSQRGVLPIGPGYTSPYFPQVAVMRWDRGGGLRIIERNAGQPAVQP